MATLLDEPRWSAAAQALVEGCIDLPSDEQRVALLSAVCERLGDELYPAFLRLLSLIGQHGDHAARAAVARALVHALRTGRLPSGRRGAWGASAPPQAGAAFGARRSLGPLEYLCAWHTHADTAEALSAEAFYAGACALMELVGASKEARLLYCEKLLADVDDPLGGALARPARQALRALAIAWAEGAAPSDACTRFLVEQASGSTGKFANLLQPSSFSAR
jgi:hypothetical protein